MKPLISVIVPIYNVEKYLNKCIDSILNQTYENLEILLIDDGSTDSSAEICENYAKKDSRVKPYHKQNEGLSKTRNFAISVMTGDYYCFVDGDDSVHCDYIMTMYNTMVENQADLSMCLYYYVWNDGRKKLTRNINYSEDTLFTDTGLDALRKILYGKIYAPSCCCKLFDKSKTNLYCQTYLTGEDVLASVSYFPTLNKVAMLNKPLYYYLQNDASLTKVFKPENIYDTVLTATEIYKQSVSTSYTLEKAATYYLIEKNLTVLMKLYGHEGQEDKIKHIKENIKKYRKTVIMDSEAELRTRIACLISYFGIGTLCKIRNMITK
ncbi:MAG: glycosyltransferase family 2 protein [Clostridia bacterium]|nr:glycosyltransferase family 2 protein [Clostridia bacterium]